LIQELTGAEAALVVNNNAGATMLTLAALAAGKEVVVSRGQLIEIGGSFRLPDVMAASGARLKEVGTTNKTRLDDFRRAIGPDTAALMRVHTSNFRIVGFSESVSLRDLVKLAREYSLVIVDDLGSGAIQSFQQFGFENEPVVGDSIRTGADVVLFSGDKLLGGPQCGILAGRRDLITRIGHHPIMRALRVGKLTLAALEATLRLHRDPERARESIPLLRMLGTSMENLKLRAEGLATQLSAVPVIAQAEAIESEAYLGGGAIPEERLATWCVAIAPRSDTAEVLAKQLRTTTPPVVGRIQKERLLLDLRSVMASEDAKIVDAVSTLAASRQHP
jgi:L-seryl-tRNA(Ser) seleniumtransferase